MALIDIKSIKQQAQKEVGEEISKKAVEALKKRYKELETARDVVRNIERTISDLEQSIEDGSFTG